MKFSKSSRKDIEATEDLDFQRHKRAEDLMCGDTIRLDGENIFIESVEIVEGYIRVNSMESLFPPEALIRIRRSPAECVDAQESMAWLANALEQYNKGEVITVPSGTETEEEFFAWLKNHGRDCGTAGSVPENISVMIEKVRKWGIEHTGHEPSISCFHRALDELQDAVAGAILPPAMSAEQVPDAIQLLQRVAASTTDKPAVAVSENCRLTKVDDLKRIHRDLDSCQKVIWLHGGFDPSYCKDAQESLKLIDAMLSAPSAPSHSQQSAQRITEQDVRELLVSFTFFRLEGHAMAPLDVVEKYLGDNSCKEMLSLLNNDRCPSHESEQ